MATLHILHSSPSSTSDMENALRVARPGDAIVLIQDAVFTFMSSQRDRALDDALTRGLKVFAMKLDLDARSVKAPSGVEIIGYDGLVELITRYERTVS